MKINTHLKENYTIIIENEGDTNVDVKVFHKDNLIATLNWNAADDYISSIEFEKDTEDYLFNITLLILDTKDELITWLKEVC